MKKNKFKPQVTRVKLNPEQAVLSCSCYDSGKQVIWQRKTSEWHDFVNDAFYCGKDIFGGKTKYKNFYKQTQPGVGSDTYTGWGEFAYIYPSSVTTS